MVLAVDWKYLMGEAPVPQTEGRGEGEEENVETEP